MSLYFTHVRQLFYRRYLNVTRPNGVWKLIILCVIDTFVSFLFVLFYVIWTFMLCNNNDFRSETKRPRTKKPENWWSWSYEVLVHLSGWD